MSHERGRLREHPVYGLTLKQPWAWCIAAGHKTIENRPWKPWSTVIGKPIAIHAGMTVDKETLTLLSDKFGLRPVAKELAKGAIVAVAFVDGFVEESEDPWFFGPYGWLLRDVVAIPPVPCRGALGLWRIPERVRRTVIERTLIAVR